MSSICSFNAAAKLAAISVVLLLLGLGTFGIVLAANPHEGGATGQPGKTCGNPDALSSPGNAAAAPGSAFNPDGQAGSVYAGNNPNAPGFVDGHANDHAVSQYDVACFQVSQNPQGQSRPCPDCGPIAPAPAVTPTPEPVPNTPAPTV